MPAKKVRGQTYKKIIQKKREIKSQTKEIKRLQKARMQPVVLDPFGPSRRLKLSM